MHVTKVRKREAEGMGIERDLEMKEESRIRYIRST